MLAFEPYKGILNIHCDVYVIQNINNCNKLRMAVKRDNRFTLSLDF